MWFIYILLCKDGSYYIGATNNVDKRVRDHMNGKGARYTKSHPPQGAIYSEAFKSKSKALQREAELKTWTKKKKTILVGNSKQNLD